jgi:hypothetical protein
MKSEIVRAVLILRDKFTGKTPMWPTGKDAVIDITQAIGILLFGFVIAYLIALMP